MTVRLPGGFRVERTGTGHLVVNDGPNDSAAGNFAALDAPALWSRQVLTDGQLRAIAIVPAVSGTESEQFQAVHATAEEVAAHLGLGAVEVAVCWPTESPVSIVVTDASLSANELAKSLPHNETVLAMASGAAHGGPTTLTLTAEDLP